MHARFALVLSALAMSLLVCGSVTEARAADRPSTPAQNEEQDAGFDLEQRGIAISLVPDAGIEFDIYLTPKVTLGASFSGRIYLDDCQVWCKRQSRVSLFSEYLVIGRWAQFGPRVGLFAASVYEQGWEFAPDVTPEDHSEVLDGKVFGPTLGFSAYFTPFDWVGLGISPAVLPGVFVGRTYESGSSSRGQSVVEPDLLLKFMVNLKFGDMDGPEPD